MDEVPRNTCFLCVLESPPPFRSSVDRPGSEALFYSILLDGGFVCDCFCRTVEGFLDVAITKWPCLGRGDMSTMTIVCRSLPFWLALFFTQQLDFDTLFYTRNSMSNSMG